MCVCEYKKDLNRIIEIVQKMSNVDKQIYIIYKTNGGYNFVNIEYWQAGEYEKLIQPQI